MAKRFYNPSQGTYVSQFVPDNLPVDLMLSGLQLKQNKYDKQSLLNDELQAYKIKALPGEDTRYATTWKGKIDEFTNNSLDQDLASPEFQRQYKGFIKDLKNDKDLQTVQKAYETHEKALERIADLKKKGETAAADEMLYEYQKRYGLYTDDKGQGFRGDVTLNPDDIGEGVDKYGETIKYFKDLEESGSENVAFLDQGIAYKNGWTGISDKRVKQQADNLYNDWAASAPGRQYDNLYNMQKGISEYELAKLTPDKRKEFVEDKENWKRNQFLQIGRTVVHGKSTTNIDDAYNVGERRRYEELDDNAIITGQLQEESVANPKLSWDTQLDDINKKSNMINEELKAIANGKTVAPGTESYLKKELNNLQQEKQLVQKDKNNKYREFYNKAKEEVFRESVGMQDDIKSPYKNQQFKEDRIKTLTNQKWKEYLKNESSVVEYVGTISVPKTKGSIASAEEKMIQGQGGAGYKFFDAKTGKAIPIDDLSTFELTGLTQNQYKGGTGKVGRVTTKEWIVDPNNEDKKKLVEVNRNVIAVSRDPNRQVSNISYANTYFDQSKQLRANGNTESAIAAERQAMRLLDPQLSTAFDNAGKSSSFKSGPIGFRTSSGTRVLTNIEKLDDGSYNVSLMDENRNILAPTANFSDIERAKQQILNISLK